MESPLTVALQIRECLQNGDSANALRGLEELIDALARSDRFFGRSFTLEARQHVAA